MKPLSLTSATRELAALLSQRTRGSFTRPPGRMPWPALGLWVGLYFAVVLAWGWSTGFLKWQPTSLSPGVFARTCLILLVFPGLAEELVFRVWMLPHPRERAAPAVRLRWLGVSTGVFVLWHVLNAWWFFPVARPVFWDGRFLALTGWMGWVAGGLYLRGGSIWMPAALHWLTVVAWKACFAGPVFFE